jgi:hypothetical protein
MADTTAARLDILIDIKARLDEIARANAELRNTRNEAKGASDGVGNFFNQFRQGLGLGAGMFTVASAVSIVKNTIVQTTMEAMRMAGAIKDGAESLGMSRQAYQVLGEVMREVGGDQERMTQAIAQNNRSLLEARSLAGPAAAAYRTLGLNPAMLEGLTVERRLEAIGRAIAGATDKTEAFSAAGVLLGSRNLPTLLNALRLLGTEGYAKLAEEIEKAGKIMGDETVARLDRAEKAIANFKRAATIFTGEGIAGLTVLKDSFVKDTGQTLLGMFKANFLGDYTTLVKTAMKASPEIKEESPKPDPTATEAALVLQRKLNDLRAVKLELLKREIAIEQTLSSDSLTEEQKRDAEIVFLDEKARLLNRIADITEKIPVENGNEEARSRELLQLRGQAVSATVRSGNLTLPRSEAADTQRRFDTFQSGKNDQGGALLSPTEGLMAGFQTWSMQVGSVGEQIAGTLTGTIGGAISTLSEGVTGLITGTREWGEVGQQMGLMFLQSLVQIGLQMAAQKVIEAGLLAFHIGAETTKTTATVTGAGIRAAAQTQETAATKTSSLAKLADAAIGAMKAMSSIPYVGPILAIAAMGAILAAGYKLISGGFETGGYTSPGPRDKPAGVVHAGEWVAPKWMVESPKYSALIAALEGERSGEAGYSTGGFIKSFSAFGGIPKFLLPTPVRKFVEGYNLIDGTKIHGTGPGPGQEYVDGQWRPIGAGVDRYEVAAGGSAAGGSAYATGSRGAASAPVEGRSTRYLVFSDDRSVIEQAARSPDFENIVVDISRRNRGVIMEGGA